jgi:hypothetical protein
MWSSSSGSESVQVFLSFVYICIAVGDPVIKKGGLKELYDKGPQSSFFLVKFWVSIYRILNLLFINIIAPFSKEYGVNSEVFLFHETTSVFFNIKMYQKLSKQTNK